MPTKNSYDVLTISKEIQQDIMLNKTMIILTAIAFIILLMLIVPMSIWIFLAAFIRADMPFFDLDMIDMFSTTRFFLIPYSIILVYYFAVMYFKDKKLHLINKKHFKKATISFLLALLVAFLPFILHDHFILTVIYFVFFISTVYYLSLTYYDVQFSKAYNIYSTTYRDEDLGWFHGAMDNPLSMKDDINRTRLMVQSSTLGFDIISIFIETIVRSMVFVYASRYTQYTREAARLFDYLLEERLDVDIRMFSSSSKIILESLNYLSFREGKITLYERGEEVEKLARIQKHNHLN